MPGGQRGGRNIGPCSKGGPGGGRGGGRGKGTGRSAAKQSLWILALAAALFAAGCGVWMNPGYSELLDKTAVLSAETARRAEAGDLTPAEMVQALKRQAETWQRFRDARDGKEGAP